MALTAWGVGCILVVGWPARARAQFIPQDPTHDRPERQTKAGDDADANLRAQAAADAKMVGKPVYSIDLDCDLDLCDNPVTVDKLRDLAGLYVGMDFSRKAIRIAEQRLAKTGFFAKIDTTTQLDAQGVSVSIQAHGAVLIRRVGFSGVDGPPFESDLRKLLIYRQGQPYQRDKSKAGTQLRTLRQEFEKEGYFGTQISMYVHPVKGQDHLVDVLFRIKKGKELDICDIGIRGLRSMPYEQARQLLLSGHSILTRRFKLFAPKFTTDVFKKGQEALIEHYRQMGYFQARILQKTATKHPKKGCVTELVDLSEGPRWKLEFSGDLQVSIDELKKELPFYESGYVDSEEIRRAERAIRQLYETRGYPFAQVTGKEIRRDRLDRVLNFHIKAGPHLEIRDIVLHGNKKVSREQLLANFGTRRFGLFAEGGYLQTEQLLGDLDKLEAVYRSKGFLQARVTHFKLQVLPGKTALRIHIYIDEGERTWARQVRFQGNRTLTDSILTHKVTVRSGKAFVPMQLKADRSRLVQLYAAAGYPLAKVDTTCRALTGEDVECRAPRMPSGCVASTMEDLEQLCHWTDGPNSTRVCQRVRPDPRCKLSGGVQDSQVRVEHHISEGPFVRVGNILLKGNFHTSTSLIYQEIPLRSGDLFDVRKILEGQANMRSLGVFDSVSIEAIGLDDEARKEDKTNASLLVSVEESRNRYLDFKFGFEGRDLLGDSRRLLVTGETQYNDDNFLGQAQRLRPHLIGAFDAMQLFQAGSNSAGIASSQPVSNLDYLFGGELVYNHPRFLKEWTDIDKLSLTIAPYYMLDLLGVTHQNVLREEWGLRMEVRKELNEVLDRLFVSFGIEGKQAALWTPADPTINGERIFSPRRVTGKLIPEITLDRRDSPLNPSSGYYLQLQPAVVSGATLVQGGEDAIKDSYLRLLVTANLYLKLFDHVTLGQGLRYGHILPFFGRDRLVTEDERFRLGGAGSVRGFSNDSLGPLRNGTPSGGEFMMNYNAELRYPLIRGINLYGAVFFDAGLLADCFSDVENSDVRVSCYDDAFGGSNPFAKVRTSAGLGVRYLIADQIPLVFDYGMVLDRRPGESFGTMHFNLGYTF